MAQTHAPESVLDFWFPDTGHEDSPEAHAAFWDARMQGGMDARIVAEFAGVTEAAATGALDHWAETRRGRLALLIALDQFPRSLWRDRPGAFGQDIKATRLVWEAIGAGDVALLAPWEAMFLVIANGHCEGPDHLERLDRIAPVVEEIIARLPPPLAPMAGMIRAQQERVRAVIARFGRHPHRNAILGRLSSPEEAAYVAAGDFPHLRRVEDGAAG